jgi:hypothetical protein
VHSFTRVIELTSSESNMPCTIRKQAFKGRSEAYRSLGQNNNAQLDTLSFKGIVWRAAETPRALVDLSDHYNAALQENWHNTNDVGNNLELLPQGVQEFNGVRYDVRGIIQLASLGSDTTCPEYPKAVSAIPIRQIAGKLHFFHGVGWTDTDGTVIAHYKIHFADGSTLEAPVVYGRDVRNWQFWPEMPENEKAGGTIAWKGTQPRWQQFPGWGVRLYQMTWNNPNPEKEIATLDFVSTKQNAAPFLIAITAQ